MVWGDMTADSAADQYPQANVCPECVAEQEAAMEDNQIVAVEGDFDSALGPECYFCGAEIDEE